MAVSIGSGDGARRPPAGDGEGTEAREGDGEARDEDGEARAGEDGGIIVVFFAE